MKIIKIVIVLSFVLCCRLEAQEISVKLGADAYYTSQRKAGFNNIVLGVFAAGNNWVTNWNLAASPDNVIPEEANIEYRIFDKFWLAGGVYNNWDDDYTFNKWFTQGSLTDFRSNASPYLTLALKYAFHDDLILTAGTMLAGFKFPPYRRTTNNESRTVYAKLQWDNIMNDWQILLSCLTGKEMYDYPANLTQIYLSTGGTVVGNLQTQISGKIFRDLVDTGIATTVTYQTLLRYRFAEKLSLGGRYSHYVETGNYSCLEFGIVFEYNPVPNAYLRLEGDTLLFSKTNVYSKNNRYGATISAGFNFEIFEWKKH